VVGQQQGHTWLIMKLSEGRNRQIRRMLAAIGKRAIRLIRLRIGPIALGSLPMGKARPLTPAEVAYFKQPESEVSPDYQADVARRFAHAETDVQISPFLIRVAGALRRVSG
jgi:hypothetical protein